MCVSHGLQLHVKMYSALLTPSYADDHQYKHLHAAQTEYA